MFVQSHTEVMFPEKKVKGATAEVRFTAYKTCVICNANS